MLQQSQEIEDFFSSEFQLQNQNDKFWNADNEKDMLINKPKLKIFKNMTETIELKKNDETRINILNSPKNNKKYDIYKSLLSTN